MSNIIVTLRGGTIELNLPREQRFSIAKLDLEEPWVS